MKLVFFAVNNSLELGRHSFDCVEDDSKVMETLSQLKEGEVRVYDMSHYGYGKEPSPNAADFETDYNDEILDGGWWCIVLNDKK